MKYLVRFSVLLLATLLLNGCNDDFLTRAPLDEISDEVYWNTENDLMVYNNTLYHLSANDNNVPINLGHDQGFNSHMHSYWYLDGYADNLAPRHERHNRFQQVRAGQHSVPSSSQWQGYHGWNFVRAINVGLENYDRADIPQAVINQYAGEARLFRGWFYADKVQKFGDVPWVDRPLNIDSEELFAARTPREEAMDNILADLQFASEHLPEDWGDGASPGRLNRWAALMVKSRVALFEGTWRKYHGGSNPDMWLQVAADAAREIMEYGPYALHNTGNPDSDYNAFHRVLDPSGSPEVMYWRKYEMGTRTNHVQDYFNYTGGATKSLVEDYLATDGLPITLSPLYQGDERIEDLFENRDPRLRQSILHPEDSEYYMYHNADGRDYPRIQGMSGGRISTTGYHVVKHYNAEDMIGKAFDQGEHPAIVLRFGEALLNYAEAKAELGDITQQDLDMSINLLRDRVDMPPMVLGDIPMDPRYEHTGLSPLIIEIRRERRVELFLEGFRYNDLRRWAWGSKLEQPDLGIRWNDEAVARYEGANVRTTQDESGNTYIDVYQGTDWANPVFDESRHYLWPIPISALSQNPEIGQNPGW
jgi:starch-binding outer membrane protein, SusD/RagB family